MKAARRTASRPAIDAQGLRSLLNIGIIGIRGQAARWASAAMEDGNRDLRYIYHPAPDRHLPGQPFNQTHQLDDLITGCDIIVIASPTHTHLHYLKELAGKFEGLIVVEKPIVASLEECEILLDNMPRAFLDRVYVNHSFRAYPWARRTHEILDAGEDNHPFAADFQVTHDLAYKPHYRDSWRADSKTHWTGPAETLGIHLIDLIHYLFGPIESVSGQLLNLAKTGSAPDTASMFLTTRSQVSCTIHTSYAASAAHYMRIVAPGFILTYRDGDLSLQERPPVTPNERSRPPAERSLLETSPDQLSDEALCHHLRSLQGILGDTQTPGQEIATAYQGIANVAVLGSYLKSVQQGSPSNPNESQVYTSTVDSFG